LELELERNLRPLPSLAFNSTATTMCLNNVSRVFTQILDRAPRLSDFEGKDNQGTRPDNQETKPLYSDVVQATTTSHPIPLPSDSPINLMLSQLSKPLYSDIVQTTAPHHTSPQPGSSLDPTLSRLSRILTPFLEYENPFLYRDWDTIWSTPPIILDTSHSYSAITNTIFHSSLFRLYLSANDILENPTHFPIKQGTTIVFKNDEEPYEKSHNRYVVVWSQWIHKHRVYLKVVGVNVFGDWLPFNHSHFPSFILVVPICVANVPFPFDDYECLELSAYEKSFTDSHGQEVSCQICTTDA
jgi:hypothetical protein